MELPIDPTTILALARGRSTPEPPTPPPGLPWQQLYAAALGQEAYVWAFPWLYLTQLCWLWTSEAGKAIAEQQGLVVPWAPMNSFFHAPKLSNPANQSGGSPNCDTLYSTAWVDLSAEPLVLSVPEIADRFYNIEMASLDSDNFAYVGTRATGTAAADYLVAGPGWFGTVPEGVLDVLQRSRTPIAFLLGRTGVNSDLAAEVEAAYQVSKGYRLTPLSRWGRPGEPPLPPPHALVPESLDYADPTRTWVTINRAMDRSPPGTAPAPPQAELIALFATIGVGPGQHVELQTRATQDGLHSAAVDGLALLTQMSYGRGKQVNNWTYPPLDLGRAGQAGDYITRAALQALGGIIANDPDEAVYLNCSLDSDGTPLSSQTVYRMVFEPPPLGTGYPPIVEGFHGFWSVTLYKPDYNLVEDSQAYTVNSYDPKFTRRTATGGLGIQIQYTDPGALPEGYYWLQSPEPGANADGGSDFFLILRVYVPGPAVSGAQTWPPPPIARWSP